MSDALMGFLLGVGFSAFLVAMAWLRERNLQWFREVDRRMRPRRLGRG